MSNPTKPPAATEAKRTRKAKPTPDQVSEASGCMKKHIELMSAAIDLDKQAADARRDAQLELERVLELIGPGPITAQGATLRIRKSKRGLELVPFESGAIKL